MSDVEEADEGHAATTVESPIKQQGLEQLSQKLGAAELIQLKTDKCQLKRECTTRRRALMVALRDNSVGEEEASGMLDAILGVERDLNGLLVNLQEIYFEQREETDMRKTGDEMEEVGRNMQRVSRKFEEFIEQCGEKERAQQMQSYTSYCRFQETSTRGDDREWSGAKSALSIYGNDCYGDVYIGDPVGPSPKYSMYHVDAAHSDHGANSGEFAPAQLPVTIHLQPSLVSVTSQHSPAVSTLQVPTMQHAGPVTASSSSRTKVRFQNSAVTTSVTTSKPISSDSASASLLNRSILSAYSRPLSQYPGTYQQQ